jgi:hypothetical protein
MDNRRENNSAPTAGVFTLMLRDFSGLFGWIFDALLGNRQASAQFRLAVLVISFMGIWAGLSLALHPPLPRVENWQMTETLFKSLFAPDVLGFMLAITMPLILVLSLAAIYLDDIFELQDVRMAMKYILQSAFALRYPLMTIEEGDVAEADKNSPLYKIGGPGYVRVKFENAAIFERSDCKARVIPSSAGGEDAAENPTLPWIVGLIWCLAGLAASLYVYFILNGSPTGLMDWLVQGFLEGEPRFVVSAILSIMSGGFIFGIFANIASRIPGGFIGGMFGGLIFGFLAGCLGYVFSGQVGTVIGLVAGMLIIVWRGRYLQQLTTIDGFERLRAVIDLREQKKTMHTIRARTRDGIEIIAQDVQIIFSVYRPEPLAVFYDGEDQKRLTFSDEAILRLVYGEGNRSWTENVETEVAFAIREEIARCDLFDLLSQSIDESTAGNYILREDFYHTVIQKVNSRRKEKGFQIEWLGLGTWRAVLSQIEENLVEMWKNVSTSQHQTSAQEMERLSMDAHYEELKRLYLHPSIILEKFKSREEKGFPLFLPGGMDAKPAFPSADLIKYELISSYREKLYRAWIIYSDQGQAVPPEIVTSLKHINHLLAHKP